MDRKPIPFRKTIVGSFIASMVFIVAFFAVTMHFVEQEEHAREMGYALDSVEAIIDNQLKADRALMEVEVGEIFNNNAIQTAFTLRDRQALMSASASYFNRLSSSFNITHLYFHLPDRTTFLRMHAPDRHGDLNNRTTIINAMLSGGTADGLELGALGTLTYRVVVPVRNGPELIGYIELGKDIDYIINDVTSALKHDVVVFVHKRSIDQAAWIQGNQMIGREKDWDTFGSVLLMSPVDKLSDPALLQLPELEAIFREDNPAEPTRYEREVGDRSIQFGFLPLLDINGSDIGEIAVFADITYERAQQRQTFLFLGAMFVFISVLLTLIFAKILGRVERTIVNHRDQIEVSERQVSNILDSVSDVFFAVDADWNLTFANLQAAALFERERDGLIGQNLWDEFPELASAFYRPLTKAMSRGEATNINGIYPPLDRWFNIRAFPARDGLAIYILDITDRLKAEADLRRLNDELETRVEERTQEVQEREASLRSVLDTAADGIITIDEHGIVLTLNPAAETIFGYGAHEVVGHNVKMLMPASFAHEHDQYLKNYMETGVAKVIGYGREMTGRRMDGEQFPLDLAVSEAATGEHRQFTGIVRDITDRKQAEEALRIAKNQAEGANRAKSEFLSSMSHDLRTPMNAILGFAQLMESDITDPLNQDQSESVDQIIKAGKHLLELINEVLDLAKIESGNITLSIEAIELELLIDECLMLGEPLAQKRQITFQREGSDADCGKAMADLTRLKQVLINLISNAVKYNSEGGVVTVSRALSDDGGVRITVADTGLGIAPEQLRHLFEPFNRLDAEDSEIEGTGIGLTITKQLVELMGGRIGVSSEVGVGTQFWVEFPRPVAGEGVALAATGDLDETPMFIGEERKITVLYVEDNPANLKLIQRLMARHGNIELLSAPSAALGLELAEGHQPNVIVMDINMPGMDGFQALKYLQQNKKTSHIPVIALSANAMPRDIEKGCKAGFVEYLTKPVNIDELMGALFKVVQD